MVIFYVILAVLTALLALVLTVPVRISFLLDTTKEEMSVCGRWLGFVRIEGTVSGGRVRVTVRLLSICLYSGSPKRKRGGRRLSVRSVLDAAALSGTRVRFTYGSTEPHRTGFFCAAGEFIRTLLRTADVEVDPVFLPQEEFLTVEASTRLNTGKTLFNLLAARRHYKKPRRRHRYGSA
jgi:hypothetical protein